MNFTTQQKENDKSLKRETVTESCKTCIKRPTLIENVNRMNFKGLEEPKRLIINKK